MKSYRQSLVLELVDQEPITSQGQLRERLKGRGIDVTQATLSRDIRDLGLVKRASDGAYRRPGVEEAAGDPLPVLRRAVAEILRGIEAVHDRARLADVAGTISGDDTILVICRGEREAQTFRRQIEEWVRT
ncbi:MAG: hypothetical protein DMF85_00465 [Acidobacteria bacterium]|nr:MAG: hypothetical protein DMF85_00465 [Acidobacteriota bacterium]